MQWHIEFDSSLATNGRRATTATQTPSVATAATASPPRHRGTWRRRLTTSWPAFALVIIVLLIWQFVLTRGPYLGVPPQYLGSPAGIATQFVELFTKGYTDVPLWQHFMASIGRTLAGVFMATIIGVPLGLAIGLNPFLDRLLGPIIGFLRPIPALAWIPIVVIWLGIGEESKIFVIFMSSLLFVTTGASLGVHAVPNDYYLVARNYGLTRWGLLRHVVLPPAMPQVLAGMRTALTIGWAVVVAAELIGASQGLGYMIRNASQVFDVNTVYVGILLIGIVGVAFEYGFRHVERKLLHWQVAR
jgi:taurine transport system permease protein